MAEPKNWAVSERAAYGPPETGRMYTKHINLGSHRISGRHMGKIQIHDKNPDEAERLATAIANFLNEDDARNGK